MKCYRDLKNCYFIEQSSILPFRFIHSFFSMTDSYINDSSDNESKNSCAKSKLEMAETLLADLNLLNNGGSGTSTASGGGIVVGNGIGYNNGNSATSTASGVNQSNGGNNNSNNNSNNNNNLVVVLLKEISKLHETNKKICRNLHETKGELALSGVDDCASLI